MKILLNSENRVSGNSHNGSIKLLNALEGEYYVESFTITDRIYNVSDTNNKVYINSYNGATPSNHTLTLTNGFYSETQLRDELSTKLNTISGNTYTVTYDSKTAKYTITETSGDTFKFTFLDNTSNSARKLIGFSKANTSYSTTHTSDIGADLCPFKIICCSLDEVGKKHIKTTEHYHTDLYFSCESSYGGTIRWMCDKYIQLIDVFKTPKTLNYRFHTIDGNDINLNGQEWILVLKKLNL